MGEAEGYRLLPEVCALAVSYGIHTKYSYSEQETCRSPFKLEHKRATPIQRCGWGAS